MEHYPTLPGLNILELKTVLNYLDNFDIKNLIICNKEINEKINAIDTYFWYKKMGAKSIDQVDDTITSNLAMRIHLAWNGTSVIEMTIESIEKNYETLRKLPVKILVISEFVDIDSLLNKEFKYVEILHFVYKGKPNIPVDKIIFGDKIIQYTQIIPEDKIIQCAQNMPNLVHITFNVSFIQFFFRVDIKRHMGIIAIEYDVY
jgi:hypothetical protein